MEQRWLGKTPSLHELYPACPELFVHTGGTITDLHKVADLTKAQGMGVVMSLNRGGQRERLKVLAREHLRLTGTLEHVLFDANRYSGAGRRSGAAPLDARWIEAQRRAGTRMALTDSPYLPSGDRAALRSTLGQARGFGDDVLVALPVHLDWLTRDADVLATAINEAGIPVALMLEHAKDPLGLQSAVLGLVKVLSRATVSVSLLRSDVSVVGAIAWGASMGAVGTGSSLRHFTPVKKSDGGPPRIPSISAFVPSSMAYRTLQNINLAIAADPDHPERWVCRCDVCAGAALDVIHSNVQAYQHSLAAIAQLADHALAGLWDFERTVAWTSACRHAHTVNEEVNADTGMKWQPPDYLGAWLKAAETADIRLTI